MYSHLRKQKLKTACKESFITLPGYKNDIAVYEK